MTNLQTAAQAVLDRWDSPLWKDQPHTGVYIAELRKAIAEEQAQAMEPTKKPNWKNLVAWWESGAEQWDGLKNVVAAMLAEATQAQQVAVPVPMTDEQITSWFANENGLEYCDMLKFADFEKVVRAVEFKHGIGAKP